MPQFKRSGGEVPRSFNTYAYASLPRGSKDDFYLHMEMLNIGMFMVFLLSWEKNFYTN